MASTCTACENEPGIVRVLDEDGTTDLCGLCAVQLVCRVHRDQLEMTLTVTRARVQATA
jgi:hypothetical protein